MTTLDPEPTVSSHPAPAPAPPVPPVVEPTLPTRSRARTFSAGVIDPRWVFVLAGAWVEVMFGKWLLVPAPADADASEPAWSPLGT